MKELYSVFPNLENDKIIIKKMEERDASALSEISNNDNVYKYISPFLYKKNKNFLLTAKKILVVGILKRKK